ncbi:MULTISPECIES: hypothetical protein [unclassified Microcoleus]|uniref:hypothetical protein n=1 Tax=unclassified Microcoleus TaxID=2642155 RepID=UPI002FD04B51
MNVIPFFKRCDRDKECKIPDHPVRKPMTRSVKDAKISWTFVRSSSRLLNTDQAKKSFRYSHTLSVGFTNGQAGG